MRYIGKTVQKLGTRLSRHISDARGAARNHRVNWIRSAGDVRIHLVAEVGGDGCAQEIELITALRRLGTRLVNATAGGEGVVGRVVSAETREKMRALVHTPESKALMRSNRKGKGYHSAEQRAKWSRDRTGRPLSAAHRKRLSETSPFKGKALSAEQRAALGAVLKGIPKSADHREKLRAASIKIPESVIDAGRRLVAQGMSVNAAGKALGLTKMVLYKRFRYVAPAPR